MYSSVILKWFLFPVYLRESALFWAVDASCARGWGDRVGRGSPSTTSSPGSPSRSRGCCWESLYSFCRLPYHPRLRRQCRQTYSRPVQCPGWKREQSSSGMTTSTALHRNDVIRVPERIIKLGCRQSPGDARGASVRDKVSGFHLVACTSSRLRRVIHRSRLRPINVQANEVIPANG